MQGDDPPGRSTWLVAPTPAPLSVPRAILRPRQDRTGHREIRHHYPVAKADYDRKRAEEKRRNATVICLARRTCKVIFAMRRDDTYYQTPSTGSLTR